MCPCSCGCRDCFKVPVPPMIPNFLAFQNRPEPPEAPAASAAARLLAEVPVFKAEKKSEAGTVGTELLHLSPSILGVKFSTLCKCHRALGRSRAWSAEKIFVWARCAVACLACIFFTANASTSGLLSRQVHSVLSAMGIEKRQDFPKKHVHNYWKGHIHISHISAISSGWDSWGGGHLPVGQFEAGRDAFPAAFPGSGGGASAQASPNLWPNCWLLGDCFH